MKPHLKRPHEPAIRQQRRNESEQQRGKHHDRRVDTGKPRDERLAPRLVLIGTLHKRYNLRHGALAKYFGDGNAQYTAEIDASRHHIIALRHIARHALACERHRVERRVALRHHSIERYLLSRAHHYHLTDRHFVWRHRKHLAATLHACLVGAYAHEVRYAVAALALSIAFKHLAYLKEQHDEHRLGKLRLGSRQETYAESPHRGYRHEEILVEHVATGDSFPCLLERVVAHEEIRHEVDKQQLPCGESCIPLYEHCHYEQHRRHTYEREFALHAPIMVMMMVVLMLIAVVMGRACAAATFFTVIVI